MNTISTISTLLMAIAVCAITTALTTGAIFLAFGHVQNDRNACLAQSHGAECGLRWEPLL